MRVCSLQGESRPCQDVAYLHTAYVGMGLAAVWENQTDSPANPRTKDGGEHELKCALCLDMKSTSSLVYQK